MLELNAAPTPSAIVAAAPAAESAPAGGADGEAATPFANVLQGQLKQPQDGATVKKDDAVAEQTASAPATAPVDALALLAPMLAGLNPIRPEAAPTEVAASADALAGGEDGSAAAPIVLAAPLLPGATLAASQTAAPAGEVPLTQSTAADSAFLAAAGLDTATAPSAGPGAGSSSAILAAAPAAVAESPAESGKSGHGGDSFAALLDAAQGSQVAAAQAGAGHRAAPTVSAPAAEVRTPVGAQGWDNEVGEKLTWMVSRQESRAELVLNPPQLGRIEVSLSLSGDQVSAAFVSASPAVREALENAVPRLREILQDAGISLGQAQVGAESFQQAGSGEKGDNSARRGAGHDGAQAARGTEFAAAGGTQTHWLRQGNGLVDTFA